MPFGCFKKSSFSPKSHSDANSFFVVTPIFNPAAFASRYELYHTFVQHMKRTGAQLITIECIFPSLGQTEFQVTSPSDPNHIQLTSNSIFWMKENLINIAVSRLPPQAKYVCWLDADIQFDSKNWIQQTIKQLKRFGVVQVFKRGRFLGPGPSPKVLRTDYSFGYSVVKGKPIDQQRYEEWYPHPGYGWAMEIQLFREIGGLPDYDIVGSGDLHFAFSLLNRVSNTIEKGLNPQFSQYILNHSKNNYDKLSQFCQREGKQMVGYVDGDISHSWHGSRQDRQYVERWKILIAHQFTYEKDVYRNQEGLLQLADPEGQLHRDILTHFQMRKEDETLTSERDRVPKKKPYPMVKVKGHRKSDSSSSSDDDEIRRRRRFQDQQYYDQHHLPYVPGTDPERPWPQDPDPCDPQNPWEPCHDPCDPNYNDNCPAPDYGNGYNCSFTCTSQY